jgi:hypothetical protein
MASEVGWTEGGQAVGKLTIHGADVPGRWLIVDRESSPRNERPKVSCPILRSVTSECYRFDSKWSV